MKESPRLKTRVEWLQEEDSGFTFTEPSMVEPVHNLSLEEILRDYSRGIVHTFNRTPHYDEGDDVPDDDLLDLEDFTDLIGDDQAPEVVTLPDTHQNPPSTPPEGDITHPDTHPSDQEE